MALRIQGKRGKGSSWSLEDISEGLKRFYDENNKRYPTTQEMDACPYLPSARSIQRNFGGLVALRRDLKLKTQADFRSGERGSARAYKINSRANAVERDVYDFLMKKFGKEFVHREYFFTDDSRTRADFFVYDRNGGFCVDVFFPSDRRNLVGCLNSKLGKYLGGYPVIFLQMNEEIIQETLDKLVESKKKKLSAGQHLMSWPSFVSFCGSRKPLKVIVS